jgi:predicted amino acid-binding ACT domain protein
MDIDGYAAWVDAFLTEVGVDEPVLVIGHSFGGGVATKLAYQHPDRVRYLVLLNAVGGVSPRSPWDWALGFTRELWPIPQGLEMAQAMSDDLVPNLLRNPIGVLRAGRLAQEAHLVDELIAVRSRGTPVLVMTSEGDAVIPHAAFEALCDAVGAEGRVVSGRHSWLLADPDTFGQVLANVVEVQVAEKRAATATTRATDVATLLAASGMSTRVARRLLREASALWLISESTETLAADLALCHPKLRRDEVRAVARPIEGSAAIRLTVVAPDRPGLLADSAAVLAWHRLSITHASATTWPNGVALHALTVEPPDVLDDDAWRALGEDLRAMVASGRVTTPPFRPVGRAAVTVDGATGDRRLVRVTARDQLGLFSAICRWFAAHQTSIEAVHASTSDGVATDTFVVLGPCDDGALAKHLSR